MSDRVNELIKKLDKFVQTHMEKVVYYQFE